MIDQFGNRGILHPHKAKLELTRHEPTPAAAFFVDRYWLINWDLSEPFIQETLPYPCINMVFERGKSGIFGIVTGKYTRKIEGKGQVFGIKFKPGAFHPFWCKPVSQLTNRAIAIEDVFGANDLEQTLFSLPDVPEQIKRVEALLLTKNPMPDEAILTVNRIIESIASDWSIINVDDVVARFHMSKRTLQRLFSQYVGVSPKWVIQRYRLQEAAERLANGEYKDWARLALDLGYFDQAHFIKDFKNIIGVTPAEFVRVE
jgi:AraC-like DNA-binding protein